ncbi:MAG: nitronate monooxygenase [Pseudomonadota bacterium]
MSNNLLADFEVKVPVLNAGMGGGLAGPTLVSAVSNKGGLGVLGTGACPPPLVHEMVKQTRELTGRPFGANIILPMSDGSDVTAVFDEQVPLLVVFWGDPQPYVADAHRRGMKLAVQVGNADEASQAADAGVDGIIIQGTQAGGHCKAETLLADSLEQTLSAVNGVGVIAAGGIATGQGVHDALAQGAIGVSMGTRFLATQEAQAASEYKEAIVAAKSSDTVLTKMFDLGWPDAAHRVIRNETYDRWLSDGEKPSGERPGEGEIVGEVAWGEGIEVPRYAVFPAITDFRGEVANTALYAGESVDDIESLLSTEAVMDQLIGELKAAR